VCTVERAQEVTAAVERIAQNARLEISNPEFCSDDMIAAYFFP
jgi:hypothetical protein